MSKKKNKKQATAAASTTLPNVDGTSKATAELRVRHVRIREKAPDWSPLAKYKKDDIVRVFVVKFGENVPAPDDDTDLSLDADTTTTLTRLHFSHGHVLDADADAIDDTCFVTFLAHANPFRICDEVSNALAAVVERNENANAAGGKASLRSETRSVGNRAVCGGVQHPIFPDKFYIANILLPFLQKESRSKKRDTKGVDKERRTTRDWFDLRSLARYEYARTCSRRHDLDSLTALCRALSQA